MIAREEKETTAGGTFVFEDISVTVGGNEIGPLTARAQYEEGERVVGHLAYLSGGEVKGRDLFAEQVTWHELVEVVYDDDNLGEIILTPDDEDSVRSPLWGAVEGEVARGIESINSEAPITREGRWE